MSVSEFYALGCCLLLIYGIGWEIYFSVIFIFLFASKKWKKSSAIYQILNMPEAIQLDKKFLSLADKEIVNHDFLCPHKMSPNGWMEELCCKSLNM